MTLEYAYYTLMVTALGVMVAQLFFKPVRIEHILTAIFSGSLVMVALQVLTTGHGSAYQYVFALGTCATCNLVWLISRALFRGSHAISAQHYLLAAAIALLVFTNRSVELMVFIDWINAEKVGWIKRAIAEITGLLSSAILALSFWESVRGFSAANKVAQKQRLLFATAFFMGVMSCTVVADGILSSDASEQIKPWLVVGSALQITLALFAILLWQHKIRQQHSVLKKHAEVENTAPSTFVKEDQQLLEKIISLMEQEQCYLQHDLKTVKIANALQVSEYKVSRVISSYSSAANVNQLINHYRIEHAKHLLTAEHSQHWSILVISLESGFASLAPFNRAFKASEGCTPNQYRQAQLNDELASNQPSTTG